ncbi:unnamed protein product [Amaranthus hypochondriacus]
MKMNMSTLAVLVLLVFSASQFITCEAALKPGTSKGIIDFFGKLIDIAIEILTDEERSLNSLPPPNKGNIKKVYCPLFRQIAKDTTNSMPTRRAAAKNLIKYCNN